MKAKWTLGSAKLTRKLLDNGQVQLTMPKPFWSDEQADLCVELTGEFGWRA
jgi:hypothetical protein